MGLRSAPVLLLVAALPLGAACVRGSQSAATPLQASAAVPAAEGTVDTGKDRNGNTRVTVAVRHLAQPERLAGGASFYVVWAKPEGGEKAQNLGTLRVDADLRGVLEAVTPLRHFELLVTPEKEATPSAPTTDTVLRADVHAE